MYCTVCISFFKRGATICIIYNITEGPQYVYCIALCAFQVLIVHGGENNLENHQETHSDKSCWKQHGPGVATVIGQRWHRDWPEVAQVSDFICDIGPRMCFFVLFVSVMRLNIFSEQLLKTVCGIYCNALCSFTVNTSAS